MKDLLKSADKIELLIKEALYPSYSIDKVVANAQNNTIEIKIEPSDKLLSSRGFISTSNTALIQSLRADAARADNIREYYKTTASVKHSIIEHAANAVHGHVPLAKIKVVISQKTLPVIKHKIDTLVMHNYINPALHRISQQLHKIDIDTMSDDAIAIIIRQALGSSSARLYGFAEKQPLPQEVFAACFDEVTIGQTLKNFADNGTVDAYFLDLNFENTKADDISPHELGAIVVEYYDIYFARVLTDPRFWFALIRGSGYTVKILDDDEMFYIFYR